MKKFLLTLALVSYSFVAYAHSTGHHHKHTTKSKAEHKQQAKTKHNSKERVAKTKKSNRQYRVAKRSMQQQPRLRLAKAHQGLAPITENDFDKETGDPKLGSSIALIYDKQTQRTLYSKSDPNIRTPIASITKLMTAMIVLDANLPMEQMISIEDADVDMLKGTHSRLTVGTTLTRADMLRLALMSSENRAASALARTYPGGLPAAIHAMNEKAHSLGMLNTRFYDGTGLNSNNVSTANDLVKMVAAARNYALIHQFSTLPSYFVMTSSGREMEFRNTNPLVKQEDWQIGVSKTGFINEAGRCLVMEATIQNRPVIIVLLDSAGKLTRVGDAQRIKRWMEKNDFRT